VSVAFRRESDEEHKEPKFEIPIPVGPNLVTKRGRALIATRVAEIEAELGGAVAEARAEALKRDLRYWRTRMVTAEEAPAVPEGQAGFGTRVRFRLNGAERVIEIVGDDEADPAAGKLAFSAPLARAVTGAGAGDFADFAGKADAIEIIDVTPIES
jgi:transcription elongation GreA/GreB family factor